MELSMTEVSKTGSKGIVWSEENGVYRYEGYSRLRFTFDLL